MVKLLVWRGLVYFIAILWTLLENYIVLSEVICITCVAILL